MLEIEQYIVVHPSSRAELETLVFDNWQRYREVPLTIRSTDEHRMPAEKEIKFAIYDSSQNHIGTRVFVGYMYDGPEICVVNLEIPLWEDEASIVKITPAPENTPTEGSD